MDKAVVNNQIVLMRRYVKQAKTHLINKLVKQVKSLEVKKGSDIQITKNKRKIERILEKIKILKKIKVDFVSKSALSKSKDWKSLIEQKDVSLQDQCLALLVNHASIQKEVEKFCTNHSSLVDRISTLIIEWEIKHQDSNKKTRKKRLLNNKDSSFPSDTKAANRADLKSDLGASTQGEEECSETETNSSEYLKEPSTDLQSPSEILKNDLTCISSDEYAKGSNQVEKFKTKQSRALARLDNSTEKSRKDNKDENQCSPSSLKTVTDYKTSADQFNVKKYSSLKSESNPSCQASIFQKLALIANSNFELSKPKQRISSSVNYQLTKSIAFLDLNKIIDLNEIPVENSSIPEDETEHSKKSKKDSFFITSDGDSDCGNDIEGHDNVNRQGLSRRCSFSKKTVSHTNGKLFHIKKDCGRLSDRCRKISVFDNRKTARSKDQRTNKSIFKSETSRNSSPCYQNDNKMSPMKKQLKNLSLLQKAKCNEPLHPSWEAKRKMKECAKAGFKGKRILFDE